METVSFWLLNLNLRSLLKRILKYFLEWRIVTYNDPPVSISRKPQTQTAWHTVYLFRVDTHLRAPHAQVRAACSRQETCKLNEYKQHAMLNWYIDNDIISTAALLCFSNIFFLMVSNAMYRWHHQNTTTHEAKYPLPPITTNGCTSIVTATIEDARVRPLPRPQPSIPLKLFIEILQVISLATLAAFSF